MRLLDSYSVLNQNDHVTAALIELHWLPIKYRISYKLCTLVHKSLHHQSPDYLSNLLTNISSIPSRSTLRSASHSELYVPRTRLHYGERAFSVTAARHWNNLPPHIRAVDDFNKFKGLLKTYLFTCAFPQ